jgi:AcrR family transcriptional regulator
MKTPASGRAAGPTSALLDAARSIFEREGLEGLSVRRVAETAGCTTMAVYSRFGGKDGLVGALFDDGFAQLAQAQATVPPEMEPRQRIVELCKAYRAVALAHPHHYALMLGSHSGGFRPSEPSRARALATLDHLADAVQRSLAPSRRRRPVAVEIANRLFAFCHGWVTLEQGGMLGQAARERAFERAIEALLDPAP